MRLAFFILLILASACSSSEKKVDKPTLNFQVSSRVLDKALRLVELDLYDLKTMTVGETSFHILGRKEGGIGLDQLERALIKMWPALSEKFVEHPDEAAIIDMEGPLGGGPIDQFIVSVYYSKNVSKEHQELITKSLGWSPQPSTEAYIKKHYRQFKRPQQAYVDDMLVHELGHLFIGWGVTLVDLEKTHEHWFAYGLGSVYDREIWSQFQKKSSPLFDDIVQTYQNKFRQISELDQKLIKPDTSRDEEFGLKRQQTFGHGKSFLFLNALREELGKDHFDTLTNSLINQKEQASYSAFTDNMSSNDEDSTEELETAFSIK